MIQTLFCKNGGHYYDRVATRGRQALSCVDHDGTGIPVKTYRAGSKAGEAAFQKTGGAVKARWGADYARTGPKAVPVKVVSGSVLKDPTPDQKAKLREAFATREQRNEEAIERAIANSTGLQTLHCSFGHDWTRVPTRGTKPLTCPEHRGVVSAKEQADPAPLAEDEYPVAITLDEEFTYEFDEQPSSGDKGQFLCESCGEWKPRKSNRGRVQKTCDECKELPAVQVAVAANLRANAEDRGERVATRLEELLRTRGTHLSQNGDRFQLQRWVKGRTWENLKVTADNWGVKHWAMDDDNAHQLKIKRLRWVKINDRELATV